MQYNAIKYEVANKVLTLTLNRPEQMNAFTVEMSEELIDAYQRASDDDDVSVIIVTGAGKAFCAGMDLTRAGNVFGLDEESRPTLQDMKSNDYLQGISDTGGRVTLAMFDCKKPIIGAINGAAVGIGATMLCAMDMRMASRKARIGFVFEKIGITQEACSSWFLPRIVGISQALEWTYTGEIFDAEKALASRFVRSVHEPDALLDDAYALAAQISDKSQVSLALARQMMWRLESAHHPRDAHDVDSLAIFYQSQTEGREGIAAFLEKRPANFSGKASTDMPPFYPWWK